MISSRSCARAGSDHRGKVSTDEPTQTTRLETGDQLPDIADDDFELLWRTCANETLWMTEIVHAGEVIWRQPLGWQEWREFVRVAAIVRERYPGQLRDLVPCPGVENSILGDDLGAPGRVRRARTRIRALWHAARVGTKRGS